MTDTINPLDAEDRYPLQRTLGFRVTDWSKDFARAELPLDEHVMNRFGLPHGGIHATLLDTVLGYCGCYTGSAENKLFCLTLSLTVNYLSRPKGKLLIAEGRRNGGGRKTFFADGLVFDETGERIATASGVFRYRSGG